MAVRSTTGSWGREIYVSVPKKSRQGSSKNTNIPRLLVIDQKNVIEDKVDNVEHKIPCRTYRHMLSYYIRRYSYLTRKSLDEEVM